jgi:diguanylate cyclase (GGDEF)-like protein
MSTSVSNTFYHLLDLQGTSDRELAVLRQRFLSLKRQFPWVYGIFVVNLMALNFATVPTAYEGFSPTATFLAIIAVRLVYWVRLGDRPVPDEDLRRELIKSYFVASVVCGAFCVWVIFLYGRFGGQHPASVVIFASMTAVGVFYGLSGFPAAARAPIYFLSLPLALVLLTSGRPGQIAIGLAQAFLILLMLRMLRLQDQAFIRLVTTRFDIDTRRQAAVESEQSALEGQARFSAIANTDPLTGLLNRRGLLAALEADTDTSMPWGLVILDLDGFKPINDTFGHAAGDQLLIEVGARLSAVLGPRECAARLGGDEFAIVCHSASRKNATALAIQVVNLLSEPYSIGSRTMSISSCAGVSWRTAGETIAELMREADLALYSAKKEGRGIVRTFSAQMQDDVQRKTKIEQALRLPGSMEAIDLAYQPIFNLDSMELRSFEALARWEHSELGWISPTEFIPLTEQISTIEKLSESLLRRAATAARSWPASVRLSFNLSPVQLSTVGSGARILGIIYSVGFPAERLQVEVTETALLADFETARTNLAALRRVGVSIVLDDFGAGYASIGYLREFNFDAIKLDGSLVTSITTVGPALPLLRGVLALCQAMGRQCIAEHIETDSQLRILRQLGCRYGQGFGLARPMNECAARELATPKIIEIAAFKPGTRHARS